VHPQVHRFDIITAGVAIKIIQNPSEHPTLFLKNNQDIPQSTSQLHHPTTMVLLIFAILCNSL
jgi:hypothetical protein